MTICGIFCQIHGIRYPLYHFDCLEYYLHLFSSYSRVVRAQKIFYFGHLLCCCVVHVQIFFRLLTYNSELVSIWEAFFNRCEIWFRRTLRWIFFTSNLCGHQQIAAKITAQLRTNKNSKTWHHTTLIWWCMVDSNACSCLSSKIEICNTKMLIMNYLMEKSMWKNHVCICKVLHVLLWNCLNFQQNVLISLKQMMKSVTSYPLLFVACEIVSDNCDDVESFEWIISRRHICH